ncbi:MAG: sugar phosphate isomerase/epimerase family protein [Elusimicrobiota bacterium]
MKLGRDFTNTFVFDVLEKDIQEKILNETLTLFSMNALGLIKFKESVEFQIKKAKELGLDHLELDCDVPNPYPEFSKLQRKKIKKLAETNGISLSVHLSYSNAGSSISSLQELDRSFAVKLQKVYVDFAADIGAKYLIMHPGTAPFYMVSDIYMKQFFNQIVKSFTEVGKYAESKGLKLHIENNVAFDNIFAEPEDCIEVVKAVRANGVKLYFNFDIGHWFTRAEKGKEIPLNPEEKLKIIPDEFICEMHLNDYIPKEIIFHPPLHTTRGPLQKANLENYWKILKEKNPEVIVLETAFKTLEQVKNRDDIIQQETAYIKGIFK